VTAYFRLSDSIENDTTDAGLSSAKSALQSTHWLINFLFSLSLGFSLMLRPVTLMAFVAIAFLLPSWPCSSLAADNQSTSRRSTLSFVYENDVFDNSDVHYTNGVRVSWIPASSQTPNWAIKFARAIPWFPDDGEVLHGYSIGQSIFTSNDISQKNPPEDARPYAGWLYSNIGLAVETGLQLDQLVLTIGVVGPASLAEQTQKLIHELVRAQQPKGWDHQLHNEPGLMFSWQRSWRAIVVKTFLGRELDLTPHLEMALGNVLTHASGGLTLRYGGNLPLDYGPPRIQPGSRGTRSFLPAAGISWYLFAGVEGRAVARNIFLDGNSFRNSRSVDKKPLVGDLQFGGVLAWNRVRMSYTHVLRTREFETQERRDNFGSVNLSLQF